MFTNLYSQSICYHTIKKKLLWETEVDYMKRKNCRHDNYMFMNLYDEKSLCFNICSSVVVLPRYEHWHHTTWVYAARLEERKVKYPDNFLLVRS